MSGPPEGLTRRPALCGAVFALLLGATLSVAQAPAPAGHVAMLPLEGVISPVTLRLVELAIDRAQSGGAAGLVIQLDTPGGLERSMRAIVQRILNAEVPVLVYVGPTGARAASAGVFITIAGHVAAMAPATNIGAAHPVALGGGVDKESMRKIENDAAAFARTIARERGRNADWAEKAVRQSVSITEREAVNLKVVDLIADSVRDLLDKVDGRTVRTAKGDVRLKTRGAVLKPIEIGLRDRFLNVITDPNVAYVLMMLGMLGLFFELSNPGVILPGVVGGISLILAFFAFQSLPFNYAGLLLILFGAVLLILEIKVVSHGVLAIGGVVSMALGSVMLFDAPQLGFRVSWWVIGSMVAMTGGMVLFVLGAGLQALASRQTVGAAALIGQTAVARDDLAPDGQVTVQGEIWRAVATAGPVHAGARVRIVDIDGLTLKVTRVDAEGGAS
ncbi:MAG: nodulation protein NfeD [Candidatus Rokubacteria bacterium]|nr:nodulation protein NfeD [Candidatus Rokubacteria bacterium]